jgi:3-oxoacyl-[acyl-carrier protein] reductase
MNPRDGLKDQVVLVTGASRGIGRSISEALAGRGARVVLTARNKMLLDKLENEITLSGGKAEAVRADISEENDLSYLFKLITEKYGKLDVLVNNAAVGTFGRLAEFSIYDFDKIITVNLRGVYLCCQKALKLMIPAKSGYIINISSMQGFKGYKDQSAYAASKHGVMGLTKSLASEVQEHGVRVSAILPGGVDTELIRQARPDLDSSVLIKTADIARTVLFLLSLSDRAMIDQIVIRRRAASPF